MSFSSDRLTGETYDPGVHSDPHLDPDFSKQCRDCEGDLGSHYRLGDDGSLYCHLCSIARGEHDGDDCAACASAVIDHDYDTGRIDLATWRRHYGLPA